MLHIGQYFVQDKVISSNSSRSTIEKTEIKESKKNKIYKDSLAEWVHKQDPKLSIEAINTLPIEKIAI